MVPPLLDKATLAPAEATADATRRILLLLVVLRSHAMSLAGILTKLAQIPAESTLYFPMSIG